MSSNFTFLTDTWDFLFTDAQSAERYGRTDPRAAAVYARRTLELSLKWLYENDNSLKPPYKQSLAAMIHERSFSSSLPRGLFFDLKFIQRLGNVAAHGDQVISPTEGVKAVMALHHFLGWMVRLYSLDGQRPPAFDTAFIPDDEGTESKLSSGQVRALLLELEKRDEAAVQAETKLTQSQEEIEALKAELAVLQAVKLAKQPTIGSQEYTESETRELMIDVMLREAGWDPKGLNVEEYEVTGMPAASGERTGTGYVDYVLWGDDGKPVGLVEAKRTRVDPKQGQRQAELYADCLAAKFGQRPIIYYSNGYKTWMWDDTFYPERQVQGFSTRDELQWKINQRESRKDLTKIQINPAVAGRPYQIEAAARVMQRFQAERRRKALIVMATGTGKTRLSIGVVEMLLKAGWVRRVLFLADRVSLVNQAKRAFNKELPHVSVSSLLDKDSEDARVVFSTYPTMLNCIDGTRQEMKGIYSAGHFDLIIIDEAHRSVYQKYGAIFDYFDSLLLGLTATPRGEVDRNTYKLFDLDDHQPTFFYELDQAVKDGYLVPPRAISVPLKFQREGIKYNELSPEEQEEYELQEQFYDAETGDLVEEIGSAALNSWLFNEPTVEMVLSYLMENGLKVEGGDRLGKTIIFAKNRQHAQFIVEQFDKNYPHLAGKFCRKIDYSINYAQSLIDDFSIKEEAPHIAVSVDMLDTGIDVPEVLNLVFFKAVRSKTKFWQMIGRGTRLCEDLFFPGEDKKEFLVFDYCENFEFFNANPEGYEARLQESVKQKIFKRRLELALTLDEKDQGAELSGALKDQMHSVVSSMNVENFIVRRELQAVETFQKRENWETLKETDVTLIEKKISGLPSPDEDDEHARRFDLLVLNLQLAILQNNRSQESYSNKVKKLAEGLEDKSNIPTVQRRLELIYELQTDEWWQDVTLPMLEEVRIKLRDLIQFIDKEEGYTDVFTNFEDELGKGIELPPIVQGDVNLAEYRKRVKRFIERNIHHGSVQRIRNNQPISEQDISALEDILFSEGGPISRDVYEEIYGGQPLGILVRSTVGLSRIAAKEALGEFLSKSPLHPDQINFLDQIVDYLVQNGMMEPKVMFDTPFTHIHDLGITGVFGDDEGQLVIELIRAVNRNAGYTHDINKR